MGHLRIQSFHLLIILLTGIASAEQLSLCVQACLYVASGGQIPFLSQLQNSSTAAFLNSQVHLVYFSLFTFPLPVFTLCLPLSKRRENKKASPSRVLRDNFVVLNEIAKTGLPNPKFGWRGESKE